MAQTCFNNDVRRQLYADEVNRQIAQMRDRDMTRESQWAFIDVSADDFRALGPTGTGGDGQFYVINLKRDKVSRFIPVEFLLLRRALLRENGIISDVTDALIKLEDARLTASKIMARKNTTATLLNGTKPV